MKMRRIVTALLKWIQGGLKDIITNIAQTTIIPYLIIVLLAIFAPLLNPDIKEWVLRERTTTDVFIFALFIIFVLLIGPAVSVLRTQRHLRKKGCPYCTSLPTLHLPKESQPRKRKKDKEGDIQWITYWTVPEDDDNAMIEAAFLEGGSGSTFTRRKFTLLRVSEEHGIAGLTVHKDATQSVLFSGLVEAEGSFYGLTTVGTPRGIRIFAPDWPWVRDLLEETLTAAFKGTSYSDDGTMYCLQFITGKPDKHVLLHEWFSSQSE